MIELFNYPKNKLFKLKLLFFIKLKYQFYSKFKKRMEILF